MLLSAIGKREVPIPEHIDIYHLTREMPPSEKTPLQCVMEVDTERAMLEREAERLAHEDGINSSLCFHGSSEKGWQQDSSSTGGILGPSRFFVGERWRGGGVGEAAMGMSACSLQPLSPSPPSASSGM